MNSVRHSVWNQGGKLNQSAKINLKEAHFKKESAIFSHHGEVVNR